MDYIWYGDYDPADADLRTSRPSLVRHEDWIAAMHKAGCEATLNRDLSMEYRLVPPRMTPSWQILGMSGWWPFSKSEAAGRMADLETDKLDYFSDIQKVHKAYAEEATVGYNIIACSKK